MPAGGLIAVCVALWHVWVKPTLNVRADVIKVPAESQSLNGLHLKGSKNARVGLIVFSDFQCPACRTFAEDVLPGLVSKYVDTGQVLLAFSDLPLESIHPAALSRAAVAECAARQGQFWEVHNRLFSRQASASVEQDSVDGLDGNALTACLSSGVEEVVRRRSARAAALGVRSTPSLFIGAVEGDRVRVADAFVGLRTVQQLSATLQKHLARIP
jgi:protein-disulfide isomerase